MEFSRPNTGIGSCSLLQGIFPTQGSNPGLPHCRCILYQLSHQRSPRNTLKVIHSGITPQGELAHLAFPFYMAGQLRGCFTWACLCEQKGQPTWFWIFFLQGGREGMRNSWAIWSSRKPCRVNTAHLHPVKVLGASGIHLALGASFSYRLYHPRLVNRLGDRFPAPDVQSLSLKRKMITT